jgi:hypothetical protein
MLAWGCGWTGGAILAGALVGLAGLVPTLFVLASTGVWRTVVAVDLAAARDGHGYRISVVRSLSSHSSRRASGVGRGPSSPTTRVSRATRRADGSDVRRPRQVVGRGHQHGQGAVGRRLGDQRCAAT